MPQGGTDLCAAVQTKELFVPGNRAVADILWKAVEMAGVPRCGYPLLAQNGKNSGNSIDKSEYLSYNLYIGNNSGGNAELVPLSVPVGGTTVWFWCRCTWFGADGKYRLI